MSRDEYRNNDILKQEEADGWQDLHSKFMQLAREEEGIERAARKDRPLRAYCDYKEHPEIWAEKGKPRQGFFCLIRAPETGLWMLDDGVSENFRERFQTLAARAGVALGSPKDTDPVDFWLHCLFLNLRENNSDQLFAASKEGGAIRRVCVASATFCSRLERKALEAATSAQVADAAQGRPDTSPKKVSEFMYSADYRSVTLHGQTHSLTERQAQVIQILHEAHTNGTPEVGTASILERLETPNSRLRDTFKTNLAAWKALVVRGQRKGTLRLNL